MNGAAAVSCNREPGSTTRQPNPSHTRIQALIRCAAVPLLCSTACGSILVSNLDEPYRAATPIANPQYWGAQSFVVDAQPYSLSWIEAFVGEAIDNPTAVAELRRADENGQIDQTPAGLLTTFVPPDVTGPASARVFSPASQVSLQPSTTYWFIMGNSGSGVFDWGYAQNHLWSGPGALGNFADSSSAGKQWTYGDNSFPYFIQVNANELGQQWNLDGDGNWSEPANWLGGAPNAVGAVANFTSVITADRTVTIDAPQTVGQLNFDNEHRYTLAGPGELALDGPAGAVAINVISGSHGITASLALTTDTSIDVAPAVSTLSLLDLQPAAVAIAKSGAGQLAINSLRVTSLHVGAGTVRILPDGSAGAATHLVTLSIAGGGSSPTATLDLEDNDMVVTGTPLPSIQSLIVFARHGGTWDQPGVSSSAARLRPNHATTLGLLRGSEYIAVNDSTFDGFAVAPTDVLVKYTYYGDTDFNGKVNFDDYVRTDNGFNNHLSGWLNGDFDGNGQVNFDDYVLIDLAFNTQSGTLGRALSLLDGSDHSTEGMSGPALWRVEQHLQEFGNDYASHFLAAVPEPSAVSLVGTALMLAPRRRRRS
jgi:hypothetical protein